MRSLAFSTDAARARHTQHRQPLRVQNGLRSWLGRVTAEDSTAPGVCLRAGRANVARFSDSIVESYEPMTLTPARDPRVMVPCLRVNRIRYMIEAST